MTTDVQRRTKAREMQREQMLEGFRIVFHRVACIMTGRRVGMEWADPSNIRLPGGAKIPPTTAGWTDGETVYLNRAAFLRALGNAPSAAREQEVVMGFKGVVHHEDSHILYTPRRGSRLMVQLEAKATVVNRLWIAFNILEDQRIETLKTARYKSLIRHFKLMVFDWVLQITDATMHSDEEVKEHECLMYLSTYGRKYLGDEFNDLCREKFFDAFGKKTTNSLERIIGQYRVLPLSDESTHDRAFKLIEEFSQLLNDLQPPSSFTDNATDSGHGAGTMMKEGEVDAGDGRDAEVVIVIDGGDPNDSGDDGEQGDGEGGQEGQGSGQAGKGGDPADDASESADGDSGGESGDAEPKPSGQKSAGTGPDPSQHSKVNVDRTIQEIAMDETTAAQDSIRIDVRGDISAAKKFAHDEAPSVLERGRLDKHPVTPSMKNQVKSSIRALREIRTELDEHWLAEQNAGRLNMDRAMHSDHDPAMLDIFDEWVPSTVDNAGIETVMCIDLSTSMSYGEYGATQPIVDASQTSWIIKSVFDSMREPITVLGYSSGSYLLLRRDDKIEAARYDQFNVISGTMAEDVLIEAVRILRHSQKPNKLLVIVTDGVWGDTQQADAVIANANRDCLTALFGLDHAVSRSGRHKAQVARDVTSSNDVARFMVDVATAVSLRAKRG